ncbi:MAG: glycosyltransferase [Chlamydiia bacterium]|nr:glycosyltransferase [Chlamydiia bacterium]
MLSLGVIFVTYNARTLLPASLPPFLNSPFKPRILVLNSSSEDGTVEYARSLGCETLVVPRAEFNHGLSREKARKALGTDIVVMVTPDAILQDSSMLETLIRPIAAGDAAVSYARQIPHTGADFFEAFPRFYNYPPQDQLRSLGTKEKFGSYTIFCSNSLAAWSNSALDAIGGFKEVLTGEDTLACAELLQAGYRVAYASACLVRHSHTYTLLQEFRRAFDTGYARKINCKAFAAFSRDERRGLGYAKRLLQQLLHDKPLQVPYALANISCRYAGYLLGRLGPDLPPSLCRSLSGQEFYWK